MTQTLRVVLYGVGRKVESPGEGVYRALVAVVCPDNLLAQVIAVAAPAAAGLPSR